MLFPFSDLSGKEITGTDGRIGSVKTSCSARIRGPRGTSLSIPAIGCPGVAYCFRLPCLTRRRVAKAN